VAATILIVEDEYAVARGIQYALQQEGYQVAVARSGEEGLEFAMRDAPDYREEALVINGHPGVLCWATDPASPHYDPYPQSANCCGYSLGLGKKGTTEGATLGVAPLCPAETCGNGIDEDCSGSDVACEHDNDCDGYLAAANQQVAAHQEHGGERVQRGIDGRQVGRAHCSRSSWLTAARICVCAVRGSMPSPVVSNTPRNRDCLSAITNMVL